MRRREPMLALFGAAAVVVALMAVFAVELSNTQAKSKRDVQARVHERAVLAAALMDSLFQTVQQGIPQDIRTYGAATVTSSTMDRNQSSNAYLALLDAGGRVIAHSRGFEAQASAALGSSAALVLVRSGHPYGLGDLVRYGRTGAIEFAVAFPTRHGIRVLLTGFTPMTLSSFIAGELEKIPGVRGAHNYLLDGHNTVLGSNYARYPVGSAFRTPTAVRALAQASGDVNGHYYDQVRLANSTWRILLAAPDGALFASVTGLRKWVPWLIFVAFALVAAAALALGSRVLKAADEARRANRRLEQVNGELAATNATLELRARELARSNSELEQFASIASHDLQEPLRKVRTFTQQLTVMESARLSDKGQDYLQRTNAAAERMQKLIEDLLKFSRVATRGRPFSPVDLGQVTREVLDDLEAPVQRSGAIVHVGELPTVSADPLQMRQLLQNLISNAIKFRRPDVVPEVTIEAVLSGRRVEIVVADNGIGFEPQYAQRIFRIFERLHGRTDYPGTGIGLALCRKIAERHGGTVIAESEPGHGSKFTVTLPLSLPPERVFTAAASGRDSAREDTRVPV